MRKVNLLKKSGVFGIIIVFICSSFVSSIGGYSEDSGQLDIYVEDVIEFKENVLVTCNTFGFPGEPSQEISMSLSDAEFLYDKIKELQIEVARDPLSDKTQQLQHEIITLADEHNLLPAGLSVKTLKSRLTPTLRPQHPRITLPRLQNKASEMFCNYISTGSGSALPIIILPRLIPIFLTPIPRLFVRWSTLEGVTSCGGLRSGTGFIAYGAQNGIALGFWGIGFSIFLPPVMAYGLFGYALFASVTAEEIELWPPNNPPVISNENPSSGTWNVPVSLSELSFQIEDADGDPMSYSVTTSPDIGSGSGTNKGDGVYTVSVSGLKSNTQYQWVVEVADDKDVTMNELSFMTEELPFDPFDEGWQYRKKITIDHTQVAGDLSYFPVLVNTVDSDLQVKAQDDGDDMLFMNGPGVANKLYHEIEHYDGSTGEFVAWVNIPSVSGDEDTFLYMYYGNPGCSSQQVSERVWDSNYVMVQHMKDEPDNSHIKDSTAHDNDGVKIGNNEPIETTGKIGRGQDFDSVNDYVDVGDDILSSATKGAMSAWIKLISLPPPGTSDAYFIIGIGKNKQNYFGFNSQQGGKVDQGLKTGDIMRWKYVTLQTLSSDVWYHIVATQDGAQPKTYINGIEVATELQKGSHSYDSWYIDDLGLGNNYFIGASQQDTIKHYFHGIIDEVRIYNSISGSEWISTEYNNQNDPLTFMSFGPEEP